jgi:hypothetical protein
MSFEEQQLHIENESLKDEVPSAYFELLIVGAWMYDL